MSDKKRKTVNWSPEQRAEHRAIRDAFREWHPGPEELIASGEAARLGLNVIHSPADNVLGQLKASREAAGLSLEDLSVRCGISRDELWNLENGQCHNPAVDTVWRYAAAIGKRLILTTEDILDTRPLPANNGKRRKSQKLSRARR